MEQILRLGALAEEAAKIKSRRKAGESENMGKEAVSRDMGKHEKDKKRHDSQFLEELDGLYAKHQESHAPDASPEDHKASHTSATGLNVAPVCGIPLNQILPWQSSCNSSVKMT